MQDAVNSKVLFCPKFLQWKKFEISLKITYHFLYFNPINTNRFVLALCQKKRLIEDGYLHRESEIRCCVGNTNAVSYSHIRWRKGKFPMPSGCLPGKVSKTKLMKMRLWTQLNHTHHFPDLITLFTYGYFPSKTNLTMFSPSILLHSRSYSYINHNKLILVL